MDKQKRISEIENEIFNLAFKIEMLENGISFIVDSADNEIKKLEDQIMRLEEECAKLSGKDM